MAEWELNDDDIPGWDCLCGLNMGYKEAARTQARKLFSLLDAIGLIFHDITRNDKRCKSHCVACQLEKEIMES